MFSGVNENAVMRNKFINWGRAKIEKEALLNYTIVSEFM